MGDSQIASKIDDNVAQAPEISSNDDNVIQVRRRFVPK
jgi:hypothetical protein